MAENPPGNAAPGSMREIFSPTAHVQQMLNFEAALARAEARAGVIPLEAAGAIASCCRVELFDVPTLYQEAAAAGTPVIPLTSMLMLRVEPEARRYVHWGATSQDTIDSALMLQMRAGLRVLGDDCQAICASCADLAEQHRLTLMPGRTLMQQALPITFGLKAAHWLSQTTRQAAALRLHLRQTLALQFGGAAGTLASLGEEGTRVATLLAAELDLPVPDLPWHTERDRVAEIAATLGILAGTMARIAGEVVLLGQTEVGEVGESSVPGKGNSSSMPQKRNPMDSINALASARLALGLVPVLLNALPQEHERAAGAWQAEWTALPELFIHASSAVERVRAVLAGLQVDPARMRANLELTRGLSMSESLTLALAAHLGRPAAFQIVAELASQVRTSGSTLLQAAQASKQVSSVLTPDELAHALEPANYLGSTLIFIDSALQAYRQLLEEPVV